MTYCIAEAVLGLSPRAAPSEAILLRTERPAAVPIATELDHNGEAWAEHQ